MYTPVQQRRRRGPTPTTDDQDARAERRSPARSRAGGSAWLRRVPLLLVTVLVVVLFLRPSSGAPTPLRPPIRVVPLFLKPETSTGQLVPHKDGLDVLRAQTEPFAIVTAVGPTRTGKSSILGRAFLRGGRNENLFEVGSGITSYTTGVWITSEPIMLTPTDGSSPMRVLLIDTEGFSGVGGLTSRTYEANLFGITYLMSSAIIFNSMFPVDASIVERMNAYGRRTLDMIAELNDYGVASKRLMPSLLWSVQSFNMHNLLNSKMSVDDLLSDLKNASRPDQNGGGGGAAAASAAMSTGKMIKSTAASAVLGGQASAATNTFVLEGLFSAVKLLPIRRPSPDDEVVANLNRRVRPAAAGRSHSRPTDGPTPRRGPSHRAAAPRPSRPTRQVPEQRPLARLPRRRRPAARRDAGRLAADAPLPAADRQRAALSQAVRHRAVEGRRARGRAAELAQVRPCPCARAWACARTRTHARVHAHARGRPRVPETPPRGRYGHVIDPSETDEALNETAALADFEAAHDAWFQRECTRLVDLLRARLRAGFNAVNAANETAVRLKADEAMASLLGFVKHLPRKSMARGVELSTFWQYPGKVATYIEKATAHQTTQCTEELFQVRRNVEARQRASGGRAPPPKVNPPKNYNASGGAPLKLVKKSESVEFEMASQQRLARIRARSKMLSGDDIKLEHQIGKAREECFVVFD